MGNTRSSRKHRPGRHSHTRSTAQRRPQLGLAMEPPPEAGKYQAKPDTRDTLGNACFCPRQIPNLVATSIRTQPLLGALRLLQSSYNVKCQNGRKVALSLQIDVESTGPRRHPLICRPGSVLILGGQGPSPLPHKCRRVRIRMIVKDLAIAVVLKECVSH